MRAPRTTIKMMSSFSAGMHSADPAARVFVGVGAGGGGRPGGSHRRYRVIDFFSERRGGVMAVAGNAARSGGHRRPLVAAAVVLAFAASACGGATMDTTSTTGVPTTTLATTTTESPSAADYADWVFLGGRVITMAPDLGTAEAVAVTGAMIVAVGSEDELRSRIGAETTVVDLSGSTLMPGFVDTHSHIFGRDDPLSVQAELLAAGITTTAEMGIEPDEFASLLGLVAEGDLRLRLNVYLPVTDSCGEFVDEWYRDHPRSTPPGERLWIAGVKLFADGGSCGRPASSFETETGPGDLYLTAAELAPLFQRLDSEGYQIAIHALGDRAMTEVLDGFDAAFGGPRPLRHRIEHNALVSEAFAGRYDRAGVTATIFGFYPTCFFTGESGGFAYRTPPPFDEWEWHWRRLIDGNPNTVFAWHADFPVFGQTSPIASLFGLVTRKEARGDGTFCEPGPAQEAGAIRIDEALRLMTTDAAYVLHREEEIGSITPGRLADLVILTDDPRQVEPGELLNTIVIFTMVDGVPEFCTDIFESLCGP
jgi:predicted amidohydrolase YtcJ